MKTKLTVLAAVTILVVLQSCSTGKTESKSNESNDFISVKVAEIQKEKVTSIVHSSGQFTTNDETILSFKVGGIIQSLRIKEGDFVRKGQVLATLNLTEIDAQVAQARYAVEKSERDYKRVSNLYKDSVATLEQLQNAKTAFDVASQQFSSANFNLSHSQIRAIADGYVLRKLANEAQYVSAGAPILETNGAGKGDWILKVGLSDREWSSVQIGDKAILETDAYPGAEFEAQVVRKSEAADGSSGAFIAELKVKDQKGLALASGLFGRAKIMASHNQELWAIPYEALLDGHGNTGYVFLTEDNRKVTKAVVEIASIGKDKVYISKGLEGASKIIVAGSPYLKENTLIKVVQ